MMSGNRKWTTAAAAAGLIAFAALIGCGGREDQKEGKTQGAGHEHGHDHGAPSPAPDASAGHQHGTAHGGPPDQEGASPVDHSAMGHGGGQHATEHPPDHGAAQHAGHGSPAAPGGKRLETAGHDHAGHSQPAAAGHDHGAPRAAAPGHDHAGRSAPEGETPSRPRPEVTELPEQPAGILKPDTLDAPAATSVLDAQRSAEMNREMSGSTGGHGGHGGHGAGTYRHVDAGRGPGAYEGSEPQTPGAGPEHHDHAPAAEAAAVYACPMHPEVTSKTPGTCPKCGMTLVERRKE